MLKYFYADELASCKRLAKSMFQDRAYQFRDRLKWDVRVDEEGEERDEYDALNPLYVIWERDDGLHGGSMRFLPTLGRCMVNDHFSHLNDGRMIMSPMIWECTRFCLSKESKGNVAAALMLAGGELMKAFGIHEFVGVFDQRMTRIYRRIGSAPKVVGSKGQGREQISVGLWSFSDQAMQLVSDSAQVSQEQSRDWFDASSAGQALLHPMAA